MIICDAQAWTRIRQTFYWKLRDSMSSGAERSRRYRNRQACGLTACEHIAFHREGWRRYLLEHGRISEHAGDKQLADALEDLLEDVRVTLSRRRQNDRLMD